MRARLIFEGIGASLLLFTVFQVLASDYPIYIHPLPVTNLVGGILVGMAITAVLITLLLFAIERLPETPRRIVLSMFAGFMIWRILDSIVTFVNGLTIELKHRIYFWDPIRTPVCIVVMVAAIACGCFAARFANRAIRFVRLLVAACSFAILAICPHLFHAMALRPLKQGSVAVNQAPTLPGAQGNRIVWILLDELSYDQAFDHRRADVELPNLDRLRDQSVSFSNIKPTGYFTEVIVPSLLLGQRVEKVERTPEGQFLYRTEGSQKLKQFDPRDTIFSTARAEGWTTGAVGWLVPYCRFMGDVFDTCYWSRNDGSLLEPFGASEDKSMLANSLAIPPWAWANLLGNTQEYNAEHLANYQENMLHARMLIDDSRIRFVFIHLPVPHPPGIYDRKTKRLRTSGSYLDNLALADQALATLLSQIDATPAASRTTLVVSSDHSFRIALWKGTEGGWTKEDEAATQGRFDERPVLMVRFPGETSGPCIAAEFDEMLEHDMFDAMVRGEMKTPEDFTEFLAQHGIGTGPTPAQTHR